MNKSMTTRNHAANPEISCLTKSNSKPYGRATAIPTAWKLNILTIFGGQKCYSGCNAFNIYDPVSNRRNISNRLMKTLKG